MGGEWDITRYSKVLHAFTAWSRPDRYHPRADGRSWAAMAVSASSPCVLTPTPFPLTPDSKEQPLQCFPGALIPA